MAVVMVLPESWTGPCARVPWQTFSATTIAAQAPTSLTTGEANLTIAGAVTSTSVVPAGSLQMMARFATSVTGRARVHYPRGQSPLKLPPGKAVVPLSRVPVPISNARTAGPRQLPGVRAANSRRVLGPPVASLSTVPRGSPAPLSGICSGEAICALTTSSRLASRAAGARPLLRPPRPLPCRPLRLVRS